MKIIRMIVGAVAHHNSPRDALEYDGNNLANALLNHLLPPTCRQSWIGCTRRLDVVPFEIEKISGNYAMKLVMFGVHDFERSVFLKANIGFEYDISFFENQLNAHTVVMAKGFEAVCCFVNDRLDQSTIIQLADFGIRLIALRCAGFNNVDLLEAQRCGIHIVRVPAYSPYAVAEHAIALLLCLNRKIHHAYLRVMQLNFSLDGMVGFDLNGKTVGVIGTGKIGTVFAKIAKGFGCRVLAVDKFQNTELLTRDVVEYVDHETLFRNSDVVSLHTPLNPETFHLIDLNALDMMKPSAILINTSRGALVDSRALIQALKNGKINGAGLDVYEEEEGIFFEDLSERVLQDDMLARLLTFPNVLITSHQGFLTEEALTNIANTTLKNIQEFISDMPLTNEVFAENVLCSADSIRHA